MDIAAGHRLFSIAAAGLGMKVTAVDARRDRVPASIESMGIEFIQTDINSPEFEIGEFDVVLLLGILYHLTLDQQIRLVKKCSHTLTILDTRCTGTPKVKLDGYEGILYMENEKLREDARSAFTARNPSGTASLR